MAQRNDQELALFLSALFSNADLVEVRPIEVWTDIGTGTRRSRVLRQHRLWVPPNRLLALQHELGQLNDTQNANIFMGVNPRTNVGGGKKCDVKVCRCVWADLDGVTPEIARWRCEEIGIGDPSIIVDSGGGVHLYWLLQHSLPVGETKSRQDLELRLKHLYRRLGCDATSDVNRLLRLPGFWNRKDARNGAKPAPCRLIRCDAGRLFSIEHFELPVAKQTKTLARSIAHSRSNVSSKLRAVLERLNLEVTDRSERDFGVICSLVRMGMSETEIRGFVMNHSKFATNGAAYFDATLANAVVATSSERG